MNKLVVSYNESREGGEQISDDPWSGYEDEFIHYELTGVFLETAAIAGSLYTETVDVGFRPTIGQRVYVVLVKYSTGGTFGSSYGHGKIVQVVNTVEKAEEIRKSIVADIYDGYCCWNGYFESLEDVQIHSFQIQDKCTPGVIYH